MSRSAPAARRPLVLAAVLVVSLVGLVIGAAPVAATSPNIVISQVYGGGGNSGAPLTNDYIELLNRSGAEVDLTGWSLQYASATGTGNFGSSSTMLSELSGTLAGGQYLVVKEAAGSTPSGDFDADIVDPTPIAMAAGSGKVALVNTTTPLGCNGGSNPCSPAALATIVDLVGYGTANFFEGSGAAPTLSNTTAAFRGSGGCMDTDSNSADFTAGAPAPRNRLSPTNDCEGDVAPSVSTTVPANGANGVAVDSDVEIDFSEPVDVAGAWYSISCSSSGAHPATASGGPQSFTLDPDADFSAGETCTVTIVAGQVTDQDTDDPPDAMAADHVFSFTTAAPAIPIYELQGTGSSSPYAGTQQTTTGVVTVILGSGFFLQDPVGDGDEATSDGMFAFTGSAVARTLTPGDEVSVTGTVVEFRPSSRPRDLTLTEFSPATVTKTGTTPLPAPVEIADRPDSVIAPDGIDTFERLEGMLVAVDSPRVIGPTNAFGEFVVVASGDAGHTTSGGNILVEPVDSTVDYNPERITVDDEARVPGGTGSGVRINNPQTNVAVGDVASGDVIGALDYQFSTYRVQVNHLATDVLPNATPSSSPVAGLRHPEPFEARIATFNVENFFDCVDAPGKSDTHPTCNAAALAALDRQAAKLAAAFQQELESPELVIIEETENVEVLKGDANGFIPGTTLPALLPRIAGNWDAVSFDASDERGIEVAFVFNSDRVTLHDAYLATTVLPDGGIFSGSPTIRPGREPLVGHFTVDDIELVVVGNHFKSKGGPQFGIDIEAGDDPLYGAFQPPTRWTEELRHQQADYVRELVDLLLQQAPGARILVGGDLNDFWFAEPGEGQDTVARVMGSATDPLTNVVELVPASERYSFIFEGNSQVLDHLLLTDSLEDLRRDQAIAHFNADYPASFGSDSTTTQRSSDHDPLVAYFCTDLTPPMLSVSASPSVLWPPNHKHRVVQTTLTASDDTASPTIRLVSVTSNEPDNAPGNQDGNTVNDIRILGLTTFKLRAERDTRGSGRLYTITYEATDGCGNTTTASATVSVPNEKR